jgi:CHAT domain-containing protein
MEEYSIGQVTNSTEISNSITPQDSNTGSSTVTFNDSSDPHAKISSPTVIQTTTTSQQVNNPPSNHPTEMIENPNNQLDSHINPIENDDFNSNQVTANEISSDRPITVETNLQTIDSSLGVNEISDRPMTVETNSQTIDSILNVGTSIESATIWTASILNQPISINFPRKSSIHPVDQNQFHLPVTLDRDSVINLSDEEEEALSEQQEEPLSEQQEEPLSEQQEEPLSELEQQHLSEQQEEHFSAPEQQLSVPEPEHLSAPEDDRSCPELLSFINKFDPAPILANNPAIALMNSDIVGSVHSTMLPTMNVQTSVVSAQEIITLEQNRNAEFEEYFDINLEDKFITSASVREILGTMERQTYQKSAVVYVTADPNQLQMVIFTAKGQPIRYTVPVQQQELLRVAQNFRLEITYPFKRKTQSYLPYAQQLYQWLIAPMESTLQAEGIDTLLFSMDAGLRTLPIAALHDGNQFLIEKYSLSLIPSISLMDPRYHALNESKVLAMGADTFPDMNSLPAVPVELAMITDNGWQGQTLLNEQFTRENLRQLRQKESYEIVHLATHADFIPGPMGDGYIYFWHDKLSLNDMRSLGLQNPAAELLVLSACRTAIGDEDSELGFAGLAIRTGVKSALASLWYVDDIGTLGFMTEFYQHLRSDTIKAEALRQAQIAMIREEIKLEGNKFKRASDFNGSKDVELPSTLTSSGTTTFSHPYYWAGFTMIGSPW